MNPKAISTMNREYRTYIVANRTGTLYIGVTHNIVRRAWQHKTAQFEGLAANTDCNRLVYYEGFTNILSAIAREKQLKRWSPSKKIDLIERRNP
ncbi:MAG TPA: GIY-YIG nuclease family protein [Terriglobales bacterium]|jgi:putative endonuclease|nr:GIY-YIG nuclease family protein [Terriglobales bacterium]